ncbi:uncharacterized protein LOC124490032 [Dermatophagoides farinae]|uniref:uncharacterized protein LOC124490032 n=1 Tax=Dermatophagoides farinae TaxID=6954 RepID=UPI003F621541
MKLAALLVIAMFGITIAYTVPIANDGRDDLAKKYEELIQQAQDALKKHPQNEKNRHDFQKIEEEIFTIRQLIEMVHFHKDDSNLQWDNLQYQTQKKKLEEMIKKLEQDDNGDVTTSAPVIIVGEYDKDKMIQRCDVVLKQAQSVWGKQKETPENKKIMDELLKCIIGLTELKSEIQLTQSESNLQMEELYLETYEKKVPDLIKKLEHPESFMITADDNDNDDDREEVTNEAVKLIKEAKNVLHQHHSLSQQDYEKIFTEMSILRDLVQKAQIFKSKEQFHKIMSEMREHNKVMRELLDRIEP